MENDLAGEHKVHCNAHQCFRKWKGIHIHIHWYRYFYNRFSAVFSYHWIKTFFKKTNYTLKKSYTPQLFYYCYYYCYYYFFFTKKNKCTQYWPEKDKLLEVGPCKMHLLKESTYALYTCRKFAVNNSMVRQLKM